MYVKPFLVFTMAIHCLNFFNHKINFTKLPYENYQNTGVGSVARCDKQESGYTKRLYTGVLGTTRV